MLLAADDVFLLAVLEIKKLKICLHDYDGSGCGRLRRLNNNEGETSYAILEAAVTIGLLVQCDIGLNRLFKARI